MFTKNKINHGWTRIIGMNTDNSFENNFYQC